MCSKRSFFHNADFFHTVDGRNPANVSDLGF